MLKVARGLYLSPLTIIWCHAIFFTSGQVTLSFLQVDNNLVSIGSPIEPLFSWTIHSSGRQVVQTSYRIIISGACPDCEDVWNSGIIISNRTQFIRYTGPPLVLNTRYIWSVNVSTPAGSEVSSSDFITGLSTVNALDYNFRVGKRQESQLINLQNRFKASYNWIWPAGPEIPHFAPPGDYALRYNFEMPSGETALSSVIMFCGNGHPSLYVNGHTVGTNDAIDRPYWYNITFMPDTTQIVFAIRSTIKDKFMSNTGILVAIQITSITGESLFPRPNTKWRSNHGIPDGFQSPGFNDTAWAPAIVPDAHPVVPSEPRLIFPSDTPQVIALASTPPTQASYNPSPTISSSQFPAPSPSLTLSTPTRTEMGQRVGLIISGVLGGVVLISLVLVIYIWRRRKAGKPTHIDSVQVPNPFNLKYEDSDSIYNAFLDRPSPASLSRHLSPKAVPLSRFIPTIMDWNFRIRSVLRSTGDDQDTAITRMRLQIIENQVLAINREINSGGSNGSGRGRPSAGPEKFREQDDVTLVGDGCSQLENGGSRPWNQ